MKLFWKIFIAVFISFVVLVSFISFAMASKQLSDMENHILDENSFITSFISREIEEGYLESRWPFDSLRALSERSGFLFWWVIRDDGTIHLADESSFMGTDAYAYFPQVTDMTWDRNVFMDENQDYGIFAVPLEMGKAQWFFWYGFSLAEISRIKKEIISLYSVVSLSALLLLGTALYFTVRRFLRPTVDLAVGAEAIGRGDLSHRVKVETKDELGQFACSFNKMADDLQRTTTSIDNLNKEITERKLAEEELRVKDKAIASSINAIAIADHKGYLTYVNPSFLKMWGYDDEKEVLGKTAVAFWQMREQAVEIIEALQEKGSWEGELTAKKKGGTKFDALLSASVVKDMTGKPIQMMGSFIDITERKRVDEELQKTIAELERSNAELERFAYIASHDLQEPLRMVASYTQLLEKRYKDRLDADAHDFIGYAVDGAKRMQQLINDLLTYSRVDTRGKPLEPTDCMTVFEAAVANLDVAIRESGAEVTSDPLPTFMADEGQLVQLFQNLIDNAIKFHGEEPPHVHVSVEQRGDEWVFSVRDNGIGIDPQYLEQAFMVFQRLHSGKYPGTGIGLSIARRIVERHGGRIWIESQPGKGTIVHFTIPAKGGKQS